MNAVFLKVLNMSAAAGWLIGAVMLLRLCLKKSPRWAVCLLWAAAAVRLVCPFSFESSLSLVPSAEVIPQTVITENSFDIQTGIEAIDVPVNDYLGDHYYEGVTVPQDNGANVTNTLALIWATGMAALVLHAVISFRKLRKSLATAVRMEENIFRSEQVDSPFVMGLLRPKIYLPFGLKDGARVHVIAHEKAHIARGDHWWKLLGYGVLILHWFNPLVWAGYILFCRDLELACDERAVRALDGPGRAEYTEALLRCSQRKHPATACPLAFGEVGVKTRVKSILRYRKPAFWAVAAAAAACVFLGICFLTNPLSREFEMEGENITDLDPGMIVDRILDAEDCGSSGSVYMNSINFQLHLDGDFNWHMDQTVQYFFYRDGEIRSAQLRIFPEEQEYFLTRSRPWTVQSRVYLLRNYLDAVKYLPQAQIATLCPGADGYILHHMEEGTPGDYDRVITYGPGGPGEIDGWYIHLQVQPLWDGHGTGDKVVDVFYGGAKRDGNVYRWYDRNTEPIGGAPVKLDAFPGVTFQAPGGSVYAAVTDPETGTVGASMLLSGMPVADAFFCDVTGDGYPEICVTSYFGSGIIDEHVQVYDYARGERWELTDRMRYDYRFREENGVLWVERRDYAEEEVRNTLRILCRDGVLSLEDGTRFTKHPPQITAEVTGYHGEALLVRPVYGTPGLSSDREYCVQMDEHLLTHRPRVGDTVVVAYDGTVQELFPPVLSGADILYVMRPTTTDLRPMLFADGAVWMDTGRAVPAEIDPTAILGTITSYVPGDEEPRVEGQSNFGCEGSRYARFEEGIAVEIGGEWFYFEPLTADETE